MRIKIVATSVVYLRTKFIDSKMSSVVGCTITLCATHRENYSHQYLSTRDGQMWRDLTGVQMWENMHLTTNEVWYII